MMYAVVTIEIRSIFRLQKHYGRPKSRKSCYCRENRAIPLYFDTYRTSHQRHRAVSLPQHGFLV